MNGMVMLAEWLKEWRWAKKLTLRAAAKQIGVGFAALHRFETGEAIDQENLLAILRFVLRKK